MGIETSEWKPSHEPLNYDFEFVVWVDSINRDFKKRIDYEPFKKYVSQAYQWLADTSAITDFRYREEQEEFLLREVQRCKDNSLYALNKRLYLKDGASDGGALKFKAWPAQEIALFIADCGYNLMLGKPRQIGGTSMFGGYAANKINVNRSMFVKFVTHNKDKGEEIGITTTEIHLPRGIGQALHNAYKGEFDIHYDEEGYLVRVNWTRE